MPLGLVAASRYELVMRRPPSDRLPLFPAWGVVIVQVIAETLLRSAAWEPKTASLTQGDCTLREQKETHRGLGRTRQSLPTLIQDECEIRPFTEEPPVA